MKNTKYIFSIFFIVLFFMTFFSLFTNPDTIDTGNLNIQVGEIFYYKLDKFVDNTTIERDGNIIKNNIEKLSSTELIDPPKTNFNLSEGDFFSIKISNISIQSEYDQQLIEFSYIVQGVNYRTITDAKELRGFITITDWGSHRKNLNKRADDYKAMNENPIDNKTNRFEIIDNNYLMGYKLDFIANGTPRATIESHYNKTNGVLVYYHEKFAYSPNNTSNTYNQFYQTTKEVTIKSIGYDEKLYISISEVLTEDAPIKYNTWTVSLTFMLLINYTVSRKINH